MKTLLQATMAFKYSHFLRALCYSLLGLAGIIILNGFLWLLIGQERVLLLGSALEFPELGQLPDTLILFVGPVERNKGYTGYSDYVPGKIQGLADRIEEEENISVLIDDRPFPLVSSSREGAELLMHNAMAYDIAMTNGIPFYTRVSRTLFTPGFVMVYESRNIWFFRWWQCEDRLTSIS